MKFLCELMDWRILGLKNLFSMFGELLGLDNSDYPVTDIKVEVALLFINKLGAKLVKST